MLEGLSALCATHRIDPETLVWSDRLGAHLRSRERQHAANDHDPVSWDAIERYALRAGPGRWRARKDFVFPLRTQKPIEKADLRREPEKFLNIDPRQRSAFWLKKTSGTSGRPIEVVFDGRFYFDHLLLTLRRICSRAGLPQPDAACAASLTDNRDCQDEIWIDAGRRAAIVQMVLRNLDTGLSRAMVERLSAIRPHAISLKPNLLATLAGHFDRDASARVGCFIVSGANIGEDERRLHESRSGVPVVQAYGLTEMGIVASECPMRSGLHVDGDVIAEVLDDDGRDMGEAPGRLVLTAVRNEAMPLIRYRTDDVVSLTRRPCACGRATPRIMSLSGRALPNFTAPSGQAVPAVCFNDLVNVFPIEEFQLTQDDRNRLELKVQAREGASPSADEIAAWMSSRFGSVIDLRVSFTRIDTATGKFSRYRVDGAAPGA